MLYNSSARMKSLKRQQNQDKSMFVCSSDIEEMEYIKIWTCSVYVHTIWWMCNNTGYQIIDQILLCYNFYIE